LLDLLRSKEATFTPHPYPNVRGFFGGTLERGDGSMHGVIHSQIVSRPPRETGILSGVGFAFLPLAVLIATAAVISGGVPSLNSISSLLLQSTIALAVTPSP
jgi:hypothetical protein